MKFTEEQLKKMNAAKTAEELIALAKAEGVEATEEQIRAQFDAMHKEGELADEELNNVAGGSQCINGCHYSDDPPHYLITTCANWCDKGEMIDKDSWSGNACENCKFHTGGIPMYCTVRTAEHDPYNDDIGNGFYR